MKRKIYDKLVEWKQQRKGETALMVEGARRVGKSYMVEEFAKKEYRSYIYRLQQSRGRCQTPVRHLSRQSRHALYAPEHLQWQKAIS